MMNIIRLYLIGLLTVFCLQSSAQVDTLHTKASKSDVFKGTQLYNLLSDYLSDHPTVQSVQTINGIRKISPFTKEELLEMYEDHIIFSRNLKTDSVYFDKSAIGIYRFGYSDISEPNWLYLKYRDHIEFIDLDKKNFELNKVLKRINKFFKRNPSFTEKEKVKMLKGAMEVVYGNLYEVYSF